jgi:endonuclease YncB( thermonuclease family)
MTVKSPFITEDMRRQQLEKIEQLKKQYPNAAWIDTWWDGDSLYTTDKPKLKHKIREENT